MEVPDGAKGFEEMLCNIAACMTSQKRNDLGTAQTESKQFQGQEVDNSCLMGQISVFERRPDSQGLA